MKKYRLKYSKRGGRLHSSLPSLNFKSIYTPLKYGSGWALGSYEKYNGSKFSFRYKVKNLNIYPGTFKSASILKKNDLKQYYKDKEEASNFNYNLKHKYTGRKKYTHDNFIVYRERKDGKWDSFPYGSKVSSGTDTLSEVNSYLKFENPRNTRYRRKFY